MNKICSDCEIEFEASLNFFHPNRTAKSGLSCRCLSCAEIHIKEKSKQYYLENKEEIKIKTKEYAKLNSDTVKENKKKYREENKDKIRDGAKRFREENKEKVSEEKRRYYNENKESIIEYRKEYYEKNKDAISIRNKEYVLLHKEERAAYQKEYHKNRRAEDIEYRIVSAMRCRIRDAIYNNFATKSDTTRNLLGCEISELKTHLESQFVDGMDWSNYGKDMGQWSIDHIIPCASFNLLDEKEQRKCFHYTNLQPLWHIDNIKKNDTMPNGKAARSLK